MKEEGRRESEHMLKLQKVKFYIWIELASKRNFWQNYQEQRLNNSHKWWSLKSDNLQIMTQIMVGNFPFF